MLGDVAQRLDQLGHVGLDMPEGSDAMALVSGCPVYLSPQITGTAAGDGAVFILARGDLWVWESPLAQFVFDEKSGPAAVELNLWGYFGCQLLRARGLSAIRHT